MRNFAFLIVFLALVLGACKSLQNEGGPDKAIVDFSISHSNKNGAQYAASGSPIKTALIVAVPASVSSIGTTGYLSSNYDAQLQDQASDTVQLTIPINTSLRLAKIVLKESCTLDEINSTQPTAYYAGISGIFSIDGSETSKTSVITFSSCVLGTSSIGSCILTDS